MGEPGSKPSPNPDLNAIAVPPGWRGRTQETADRRLVWTCAGCPHVDLCFHDRICKDARRRGELEPDG